MRVTLLGAAALAALLPAVAPAHALARPEPAGFLCGFTGDRDGAGRYRTGLMDVPWLVVGAANGQDLGATVVCRLGTATVPVTASAHGYGVVRLAPTAVTYDASGPLTLCTSVVYDDGVTLHWTGESWSSDRAGCAQPAHE
jgi:hypothetical protein